MSDKQQLKHLGVVFHRIGPYHFARLAAAGRRVPITAVELSETDNTYAWSRVDRSSDFKRVTVLTESGLDETSVSTIWTMLWSVLDRTMPEVVAIAGWSSPGALAALAWCQRAAVPAVLMSDSTAKDATRHLWKEAVKRRVVRLYAAALVAGRPQAEYVQQLGMPANRLFTGYDVVDNAHFASGIGEAEERLNGWRQSLNLPAHYFLSVARFVRKKNLVTLLQAYDRYRRRAGAGAWGLVLVGDGPLRRQLEERIRELGIEQAVLLPGFKQYNELPIYYGLAGAFVHTSTTDQWGLVVNEAMAAGLPVLVSEGCGCAEDLVHPGRNGFTFDPFNLEALSDLLLKMASGAWDRRAMGNRSREIIADWPLTRFADGLLNAALTAKRIGPPSNKPRDRFLLRLLANRPYRMAQRHR